MTYQGLEKFYTEQIQLFKTQTEQLQKRYDYFSMVRLISFVIIVAVLVLLWSYSWIAGLIGTVVLFAGFVRFVFWHQAILKAKKHAAALWEVNKKEIACLSGNYSEFDAGEDFKNPLHPYAIDLDIFGAYSFFQYLNRTSTAIGRQRFATYLQTPETPKEIKLRQAAAQELAQKVTWRQNFQAHGQATQESVEDVDALLNWLKEDNLILNDSKLEPLTRWLPIVTIIVAILSTFLIPYQILIVFCVVQAYLILSNGNKVNQILEKTTRADDILRNYAQLIEHIEKEAFESEKLKYLKQKLYSNNLSTSKQLRRLSRIIGQLNVRNNAFSAVLQFTILWDFQWVLRLEQWKNTLKEHLLEWFEALEEFDAMISLGTMYHNHPDYILPTVNEDSNEIIADEIGHPLIDRNERINNTIGFPNRGHIKLVTGSNMAGKSTFLRSVGLNIAFAMIGAKVCARRFEIPTLNVYTSMRTQDALHESTSSFYAELKRLKAIIESVETNRDTFFLLDEILKGTNSNDRHTGSKALIQQLIASKGMGLIATHDLELGAMEAKANGTIENLCMEVEVHKDKLVFDYTIKPGVSKSFNATYLMRNMGIKV